MRILTSRRTILGLCALLAAAALATPGLRAQDAGKATTKTISPRLIDRGTARTIRLNYNTVTGESYYQFDGTNDIDITSMTISALPSPSFGGATFIVYQHEGDLDIDSFIFSITEPGVQHLTFNPPVRLRSLDFIQISGDDTKSTPVSATLHGINPEAVKSNAMVVK